MHVVGQASRENKKFGASSYPRLKNFEAKKKQLQKPLAMLAVKKSSKIETNKYKCFLR